MFLITVDTGEPMYTEMCSNFMRCRDISTREQRTSYIMGAWDVSGLKRSALGRRASHFEPDTSRAWTHDITILCHRHFLVTTTVTMTSNGPIVS